MRRTRRVIAGRQALAVAGIVTATVPALAGAQHARPRPVLEPAIEFTRVLPETCLGLPYWVDHLRREGRLDTTRYTPERDRLSPEARAEVARCRAALDRPSAPPWQWPALARAALAVGDDAAAQRWHAQYLAHVAGAAPQRRAWAQHLVAIAYADAQPPRIAAAEAALRALDAMGAPAARARVLAHGRLMEAARRQWNDTVRVREARACLRAYRELSPAVKGLGSSSGAAVDCVLGYAEVVMRQRGGAPALAILDTGIAVLKGTGGEGFLQRARPIYALVGQSAAPLEVTRWFRCQGTEPKPARGTVTLLHYVDHRWGSEAEYQGLRRLVARFAGQPFELIAHTKTLGFIGDSAAPLPPEREIGLDSAYFYGYAGLPGLLAVSATQFTFGVDGRRLERPTPQEQHYRGARLVLINKRGRVRYVDLFGGVYGHREEMLARLIETLLEEP